MTDKFNFTNKMLILVSIGLLGLCSIYTCKPQELVRNVNYAEVIQIEADKVNSTYRACNEKSFYAPQTEEEHALPIRTVRVNFHYVKNADSTSNYSIKTGTHFAQDIVKYANNDLAANQKMLLPIGNTTPVLPIGYRYVLTPNGQVSGDKGIYFHYDNEEDHCYFVHQGKNRNSYRKDIINQYAVNPDSVLNVFILPHHPDSVKSRSYSQEQTGIALGTSVKISGIIEKKGYQPWLFRGLLNHEIGHVLGLAHSWAGNDGCDDTPKNPNCWHRTKNGSACDSLGSNNVMDYNMSQAAWSPCQLSRIHYNFSKLGSRQRKLLIPNWCQLDTSQNKNIRKDIIWEKAMDLSGHIIIHEGATLKINCRVSLPKGARILVKSGGHLILNDAWLHNDCGDQWKGIEVVQQGKKGPTGKVTFVGTPKIEDMAMEWKPNPEKTISE